MPSVEAQVRRIPVRSTVHQTSTLGKLRVLVEQVSSPPTQEQINAAVAAYIEEHPGAAFGISEEVKQALLQIAEKVAYIDANGQDYYDDLYDALYAVTSISLSQSSLMLTTLGATQQLTATTIPSGATVTWSSSDTSVATVSSSGLVTSVAYGNATITATAGSLSATCSVLISQATLMSIDAVYTQSGTVYDDATLDSLKSDLVVTAYYSDSTSAVVTNYTLSGTLTAGTSTITCTYGDKSDTFTVSVTEKPAYVMNGLVHWWDAINNVGTGVHSSDTTTWKDLVGNVDIVKQGSETSTTWTADALYFNPTEMVYQNWDSSNAITYSADMTIEICLEPTTNDAYPTGKNACFANFYGSGKTAHRRFGMITTDNTVGVYFNESSSATYPVGESLLNMRSIVGLYTAQTGSSGCYVNGVSKTKSTSYKHTYGDDATRNFVRIGSYSLPSASAYHFLGKIHSMRVYNRVLTAQEIAANLAVDNARFNLGLTL